MGVNDVSVMGCAAAPPPGLRTLPEEERGAGGEECQRMLSPMAKSQGARGTQFGPERDGGQAVSMCVCVCVWRGVEGARVPCAALFE